MARDHYKLIPAACILSGLLTAACASIGNPSGGPRDEDPPRFVRSVPPPGSTGFKGQRVTIDFDEIVNVKDAFTKVVVSPPSETTPRVSSQGRRITVDFPDGLADSTTYTINFGDAIEDNNEANPLENFRFTFSTGPTIDTLSVSGMVLGALDLEPQKGMIVGVHSNLNDSAFRKLRFDRIARTDEYGRFVISGLAPGTYRVFALTDNDNDLRYSSPEEPLAFFGTPVVPYAERIMTVDSIFNLKSGKLDSVSQRERTLFLPNNILLRSYLSSFRQQFVAKSERPDSTRLDIILNSAALRRPEFTVVGAPSMRDWYIRESSPSNDTITLWLRNHSLMHADTLRIAMTYERTDSLMKLVEATDTIRFTLPRVRAQKQDSGKKKRKKEEAEAPVTPLLGVRILGGSPQEVNLPLMFETDLPLARLDTLAFHLDVKKDSLWTPLKMPVPLLADSLMPRRYSVSVPWAYGTEYRLTVDSLAMTAINGLHSKGLLHEFKTRPEKEYSSITLSLTGLPDSIPAFVELLNESDKPLVRRPVEGGRVVFPFLTSGKYYVRMYMDFNGNGQYDAGDYDSGVQPDLVYYYPRLFNLKQNWEESRTWDIFSTPVDKMKPQRLLKNKPKKRKGEQEDVNPEEEDEENGLGDIGRNPFNPNQRRNANGSWR